MAKQDNPIARLEYSGPIPPASELEQYNKAFPKAAEIILSMAVEQSAHRREIEKSMMKYNFERSRLGLAAAFTLSLSALGLSGYLIVSGHDIAGAAIFGSTLVSIVTGFLKAVSNNKTQS